MILGRFSKSSVGSIVYTDEKKSCKASALSLSVSTSKFIPFSSVHFKSPTQVFDVVFVVDVVLNKQHTCQYMRCSDNEVLPATNLVTMEGVKLDQMQSGFLLVQLAEQSSSLCRAVSTVSQ